MRGGTIVATLAGREEDIEQGLITTDFVGNICGIKRAALHVLQCATDFAQAVIAAFASEDFHGLEPCYGGNGITRQRSKLHEPFIITHNGFVEVLHNFGTGAEGS